MGRSRRGSGSVFQRTYRDAKGRNRKTKNWYIEFVAGNRTIREATDFTNRTDAAEFLKTRISDALGGKIVLSRNLTYDDLRTLIITDYTNNARKSLDLLKSTRLPPLDAVFGSSKAIDITNHRSRPFIARYGCTLALMKARTRRSHELRTEPTYFGVPFGA